MKKILLILAATVIAVASLFGFAKLNADQIDKNDYIKEIYTTNDTVYLRAQDDSLLALEELSNFEKKDLIKYPKLTSDSKVLFKDESGNFIIKELNQIFLINKKGEKTEIPNEPYFSYIYFSNKSAVRFNSLSAELFEYDFETKTSTELKYTYNNAFLFHKILSIDENYIFLSTIQSQTNKLFVGKINRLTKELTTEKTFNDKTKITIINNFGKSYVVEVGDDKIQCFGIKNDTFKFIYQDSKNNKLESNFFFNGKYYINGTNFTYASSIYQILSDDATVSLVEELEDPLYLKIKKDTEFQYFYDGKKLNISKDIKVYDTKNELIFKEKNDDKYRVYNYKSKDISVLETEGIFLAASKNTYLFLKDNELVLVNKETEKNHKINLKNDSNSNTLENIKKDIKTQGNKILEFVKTNWFYFVVGFTSLFAIIFISVKVSSRKRRRY